MKKGNSVVTIGVFDGVHIGHRAIIDKVVRRARAAGLKSVVVTFDPHPVKVLNPNHFVPSLISLKHRIELIGGLGVDQVLVMKFNKSLANLSAQKFVDDILIKKLHASHIVVGEDFCFGKGASTDAHKLETLCKERMLSVDIVRQVKKNSQIISSTLIRRMIIDGNLQVASRLLGRPFSILGTVVKGTKFARLLGYPTANLNPHHEVVPPVGVYAVKVIFKRKVYDGVMNIGVRPTFYNYGHDKEPEIEVHIFNFHERIYGRDLEVIFVRKIRSERKFNTIDSLIEQIKKDSDEAEKLLYKLR